MVDKYIIPSFCLFQANMYSSLRQINIYIVILLSCILNQIEDLLYRKALQGHTNYIKRNSKLHLKYLKNK